MPNIYLDIMKAEIGWLVGRALVLTNKRSVSQPRAGI
jgi:hypothetical protein